jgi:hypothetical protein
MAIAPDAACALVRRRRLDDARLAAARSMRAMNEPASEHHQTSPPGVVQMPYGPRPFGASRSVTAPVFIASCRRRRSGR